MSKYGIMVHPAKIEAIHGLPRPTSINKMKSFVCLGGYYRQFVKGFSVITTPLTHLTC